MTDGGASDSAEALIHPHVHGPHVHGPHVHRPRVHIQFQLRSVSRIDTENNTFQAVIVVSLTWRHRPEWGDDWLPDLVLDNVESVPRISSDVPVRIHADRIRRTRILVVDGTFKSHFEMHTYPFDTQELYFMWRYDADDRAYDVVETPEATILDSLVDQHRDWTVVPDMTVQHWPESALIGLTCHVRRRYGYFLMVVFLVFLISIPAAGTYFQPMDQLKPRLDHTLTIVLTVVGLKFSFFQKMAVHYLTVMDWYLSSVLLWVATIETSHIVITERTFGPDGTVRFNRWMRIVMGGTFLVAHAAMLVYFSTWSYCVSNCGSYCGSWCRDPYELVDRRRRRQGQDESSSWSCPMTRRAMDTIRLHRDPHRHLITSAAAATTCDRADNDDDDGERIDVGVAFDTSRHRRGSYSSSRPSRPQGTSMSSPTPTPSPNPATWYNYDPDTSAENDAEKPHATTLLPVVMEESVL